MFYKYDFIGQDKFLDGLKSFPKSKNIITHLPAFLLSTFNEASRTLEILFNQDSL